MHNRIQLVAELAQGFEGKLFLANKLIDGSHKAGVEAVKFQLVFADELCTPDYLHYNLFKKLELTFKNWKKIKKKCDKLNIILYFDIFGKKSLNFSEKLKVSGVKIHPTDLNNYELLNELSKTKIKIIFLGIGGATLNEIIDAVNILKSKKIVIMLGYQGYPTKHYTNDISRIQSLREYFYNTKINIEFAFADHSLPKDRNANMAMLLAVGAGVKYIEKHLTIPFYRKLEDHESAYKPNDFKKLKKLLNLAAENFGNYYNLKFEDFKISNEEKKYRLNVRKVLVAKKFLRKNTFINLKDFILKRSSSIIGITDYSLLKKKKLKKDIEKDQAINSKYF